jgi:protein-S-isoprenylcysteine O-methyltransferase Ste14
MNDEIQKKENTIVSFFIKSFIIVFIFGGILFISAGTIDWPMAWVLIGIFFVNTILAMYIMDPELTEERSKIKKDAKNWDKIVATLVARIGPLILIIVAGLDNRFLWSQKFPLFWQIIALIFVIFGLLLANWAIKENRFFSAIVRIQKDRGHKVIDTGPYKYIRHPGYSGLLIEILAMPLMLRSLYALIPGGLIGILTVIRTILEDKTLQNELEGYLEYTAKVKYRLFPGVW